MKRKARINWTHSYCQTAGPQGGRLRRPPSRWPRQWTRRSWGRNGSWRPRTIRRWSSQPSGRGERKRTSPTWWKQCSWLPTKAGVVGWTRSTQNSDINEKCWKGQPLGLFITTTWPLDLMTSLDHVHVVGHALWKAQPECRAYIPRCCMIPLRLQTLTFLYLGIFGISFFT